MTQLARQDDKVEQGFDTAGQAIRDGATIHQIQTTYQTAVRVQVPRDLAIVEKRCLMEAALAGEGCFYGWGSGKNRVEGPSKECAMIAYRNFGNMAMEMRDIHETPTAYVMTAVVIDLETGTHYPRQFRQSKRWTVHGKMDEERKTDVRFQIGQSKTQRNAILNFFPGWLIDKMVEKAKEGVKEKLEQYIKDNGIEKARQLLLKSLAKYGVTEERIEFKYDKKYGAWDVDLLVILKGDLRALSDGAESADALFPELKGDDQGKPDNSGLSTDQMTPGDPKTHQGYNDKPAETQATPAESAPETKPSPASQLMKKYEGKKDELIAWVNKEVADAFKDDLPDGDEFLRKCLKENILGDEIMGNNNIGQLVNYVLALGKYRQARQADKVTPGQQTEASF